MEIPGEPESAGWMGSRYDSENRVPTLMGLLQPPPPQSPIPEVEKDGRRLLILKKARRFKLGQRAVLGLGFSFLPREHQERREQRVSQAPRGSRWVLGVMFGVVLGSPRSCRVTQAPESTGGV